MGEGNYRLDLPAVFIFLGIVQAVFLVFFFLSRENRKRQVNVFHGLMLLSIAACITEIFLMYSGYIIHFLYLVDFSEVFSLLIGPFFYLHLISLIKGSVRRIQYWHLAFPVFYLLCQLPALLLPEDAKYNAWMASYHPDLPFRHFVYPYNPDILFITHYHSEVTLISLFFYGVLGLVAVIRVFREKGEKFLTTTHPVLSKLRQGLFQIMSGILVITIVKTIFQKDLGDHILAAYISLAIYATSFSVMRSSGFFNSPTLRESVKYKNSSLTAGQREQLMERIREVMEKDRPFVRLDFSLPDLARQLNVSIHTLSQVINEGLGKSFFEFTAEYRVDHAKNILKENPQQKIDEIAERVGYSSKSSFNTAFKRITGKTPSEFRAGLGTRSKV